MIGLFEVLHRVTMRVFVRDRCTMIAASGARSFTSVIRPVRRRIVFTSAVDLEVPEAALWYYEQRSWARLRSGDGYLLGSTA